MLLRHLEVENFLSHESEQLALPDGGIFLLSGESGAGKSSLIIDAVAYSLFGPVATRARRQSDLVSIDHPDAAMSVRATFQFADGRLLTVARGLDARGAAWAQAYQPDPGGERESTLLAEGAAPVGKLVRQHLGGMTWSQFYAAFVARQSEITLLTTKRGAERKDLVQKMLGMRELDKGAELISARLRRANAEIEQLERSVGEVDLLAEERRLNDARARADEAAARVSSLRQTLAERRRDLAAAQKELEPLREQEQLARDAASRRDQLRVQESELVVIRDRAKRAAKAAALIAREREAREAAAVMTAERERLRELFRRSSGYQRQSEQRAGILERRNEARQALLARRPVAVGAGIATSDPDDAVEQLPSAAELDAEIQVAEARSEALADQIAERRAQLARLRDDGECFACQRPFHSEDDHARVIAALEAALSEVEADRKRLGDEIAALGDQLPLADDLDRVEADLADLDARLAEIAAEGEIESDLDAVKLRGQAAAERLEAANRDLAAIEAAREDHDPDAEDALAAAEKKLAQARAAIPDVVAPDPDQLKRLTEKVDTSRAAGERLAGQIPEARTLAEETERAVKASEKSLAGRRSELDTLLKLRSRALRLEKLQGYLKAYRKHLAQEIRPALEEIGSEMLARISNGKHVAMQIGDDYEIEVKTRDGALIKGAMLSGGEEIRANICLRLALTRLVSQRTGVPVGFLILDEPLPAQDPGHIERIMELLESLRPFYRQQFIISHVGDLRAADQVDYVIEFGAEPAGGVSLVAA